MNIGMLLMVEKGIRGEMCHGRAIANNKYIKNFDKKYRIIIEIIKTLIYLDANNLYGWAMSQEVLVNGFKWKKIYPNLIKAS